MNKLANHLTLHLNMKMVVNPCKLMTFEPSLPTEQRNFKSLLLKNVHTFANVEPALYVDNLATWPENVRLTQSMHPPPRKTRFVSRSGSFY